MIRLGIRWGFGKAIGIGTGAYVLYTLYRWFTATWDTVIHRLTRGHWARWSYNLFGGVWTCAICREESKATREPVAGTE